MPDPLDNPLSPAQGMLPDGTLAPPPGSDCVTAVLMAHRWSPSVAAAATYTAGGCFGCAFHGNYDGWVAHVQDALAAEMRKQIPAVAYKGPHDTDAGFFRDAAAKLDAGYPAGGGNVTYAVSRLLRVAAGVLDGCTADELAARGQRGWAPAKEAQ